MVTARTRGLASITLTAAFALGACGTKARDARYPSRPKGCKVKTYVDAPQIPVDELGEITVQCRGGNADAKCSRDLMDEACAVGGDVVHSLRESSEKAGAAVLTAKVAHSSSTNFGPRPAGCEVQTFDQAPPMSTENIGPVSATCSQDTSDEECLRTLKDQACRLGADVLWGVEPPKIRDAKKHTSGRAAHTKRLVPSPP